MVIMRILGLNIVFSALLLLGCSKEKFANIVVVGHAGNGLDNTASLYHDNSLESIELALSTQGCQGIEVDVQLSLDGTLWLYHDTNLSDDTNGSGCIPELTDDELSGLHYKTPNQESLIQLNQIPSDWLPGKRLFLDIRHVNACSGQQVSIDEMLEAIQDFVNNHPDVEIWTASNALGWAQDLSAAGYQTVYEIASEEHYDQVKGSLAGIEAVIIRNANISKEAVSLIQSEGRKVILYDFRSSVSTRKAFRKLPDMVITDNLRAAIIQKN